MTVHDELVILIRTSGSARTLLTRHAPDAAGRCPLCRGGDDQSGKVKAPCTLLLAARAATGQPC